MRAKASAIVPLAAILAGGVQADDGGTERIEEIVVVGHKSERPLREVAANVSVVGAEQLRAEIATGLADAFRYSPGIAAEVDGLRFGTEGISIRGVGGNRVAMLVDGVPLGEAFSLRRFSSATRDFIDSGFVHRAEVLHGPASALYGSDAIGGVVAIRTPEPADIAGESGRGLDLVTAWRGADDSRHGTVLAAAQGRSSGLLAGASWRAGGAADSREVAGVRDRRDFRRRSLLLKGGADLGSGHSWRAGMLRQYADTASSLRLPLDSPRFPGSTALEGDDDARFGMAYLELGFGGDGGAVDQGLLRGWHARSDIEQHTRDARSQAERPVLIERRFLFEQRARGLELNLHKHLSGDVVSHRLAAGIEFRRTRTEELRDGLETGLDDGRRTRMLLGETFPLRDFPVSDTTKSGVWLEDTADFGRLSLVAALRADRYELSPRQDAVYTQGNPATTPVGLSETDLSPKMGLVFALGEGLEAWLQYAQGFRAPPFEDANIGLDIPIFNVRAIPNPALRSERSGGFDAGLRWSRDRNWFRVGLFRTRYRDFIESMVPLGVDPDSGRLLFQSLNRNEARIEGMEAAWSAAFPGRWQAWRFDGSFYLARGENRDNGEPLNSVGPAQAVLGLDWRSADGNQGLRLAGRFAARWARRDESAGALFQPPGHAVFDLYYTRALGDRAWLRAGLMNLADRTWWHWTSVRGFAPGDPVLPVLAQPGRNLALSVEWQWH